MTETHLAPTGASDTPAVESGARVRTIANAVLRAPFTARTWKEITYLIAAFVLGGLAAGWGWIAGSGGLLAALTIVGIPLPAVLLLAGRYWAKVYRELSRRLLDTPVAEPRPFAPRPGLFGFLRDAFADIPSWRALLFLFLQVIVGIVGGWSLFVGAFVAVMLAISPIIWQFFPSIDNAGRRSLIQFNAFYADNWLSVLVFCVLGVLGLFAVPWVARALCLLHRLLTVLLLGPTEGDQRVTRLRESRQAAVDDATATLARVERDLHDGTQNRLVTIAMTLGRAEERAATGADTGALISDARASAKEALTELRDLVRGIHPPALDLGLGPALETLAARSSIPVELRVNLLQRPGPAVEAIAYFAVAELLTNVVKHAHAERAWVSVLSDNRGAITVTVRDNGIGGVLPPGHSTGGSGLAGLATRASAVDGTLTVHSPTGGPTVVTLVLPVNDPR
ncbi:sensor histidine kinase [Nocardia panacis]|nr:sensor domain-containing protein [Nocardia panacis]